MTEKDEEVYRSNNNCRFCEKKISFFFRKQQEITYKHFKRKK